MYQLMDKERRWIIQGLGVSFLWVAMGGSLVSIVSGEEKPPASEEKALENKTLICPIHYWHEVLNKNSFENYIALLMNNNYFPVAIRDLASYFYEDIAVWPGDKKPVAITFDDGLLSQYDNVLPVLEKWQLRATFFVMTDYADGVHRYMEHSHLKEISDKGLEAAPHGLDMHQPLPVLYGRDPAAWRRNIVAVKQRLEEIIGKEVVSFAYPNGSYNQETINLVAEAGYKTAVRTGGNYPILSSSAIFELPRISKS